MVGARVSGRMLLVVVLGGALGVAARAAVTLPFRDVADVVVVPAATLVVNVVGSFLLGLLAGRLAGRRPVLRAFVGTGVLGGFTTYSAFAVQAVGLGGAAPVIGMLLAVVSVVLGVAAAALGLRLAAPGAAAPLESAP